MPPNYKGLQGRGGAAPISSTSASTILGSNSIVGTSSNRTQPSASFAPQPRAIGDGIPGFRTSFDASAKGGGAFKPISENFSVSPATGTMSFSLPIQTSPSRGGYGPELALSYDSGGSNGVFGFGWCVSLPSIHRKTAQALPKYLDTEDDLVMSGADIVKKLNKDGSADQRMESGVWGQFDVTTYLPRVDSGTTRIERWASKADSTDVHWRTLSSNNETAIYGESDHSRIADTSGDRRRIFSWMLSRSYDACGNAIEYTYKQEDAKGMAGIGGLVPVWETNRLQETRFRQKYIKRIKYGNRTSNRNLESWEASLWPQDWMFELVFDYGEHSQDIPSPVESYDWPVRQDVFSQSHAGFEVRTYRLCRRLLMFHHFSEQTGEPENLVHSVSVQYDESPQRSVLVALAMSGHALDKDGPGDARRYRSESLPAWSFEYTSTTDPSQLAALEANVINLLELPSSDSKVSEWLDLDGEGMPGLLTRSHDGTLYYQRNKGVTSSDAEPQFYAPVILAQQPSVTGGVFEDLDQNGRVNYVLRDTQGVPQGFFERGDSDTWSSYSTFVETPSGNTWQDTLDLDLTGDGLPDTLCVVDESQGLTWLQNLGKKGLSGYKRIHEPNASCRPRMTQTTDFRTRVANMTGSGMSDLVEISATSVKYWPNLGYGKFGAVVEMGNQPTLSRKHDFDHARVHLIDVDGSGTTDLLYLLPTGGASLYYNLSGNSWSDGIFIPQLPATATPSSVFALDILGKGTGCLCWVDTSSGKSRIKYLDLMGDTKPHLLHSYSNGLGATTSIAYKPSTKFYIEDESRGSPWSTKLPFPVQCVSKVDVKDAISANQHSSEYVYHNGSYDRVEKQFAGFEMVEVFHRERLIIGGDESYEPPVTHTKSWFSVGLSLGVDESHFLTKPIVSSRLQNSDSDPAERLLALKGVNLRSETYSQDGTDKARLPYMVQELSYDVKLLQPQGSNKYSVVQVNPRETLSKQYERDMQDPRTTHDITLKTNLFGDVEELLQIVYPRTKDTGLTDVDKNQKAGNMSLLQTWYTDEVVEQYNFLKPKVWRQHEHEILNFSFDGILSVDAACRYGFHRLPTSKSAATWKALRTENRAFYTDSLLQDRLGEGKLQAYSVLDQTYSLAFTPEILVKVELGLRNCKVPGSVEELLVKGKYVKLKGSNSWWAPSSHSSFCHPKTASAGQELVEARRSFYTASYFTDVFGNESQITMDGNFLLAKKLEDAVGNCTLFKNDYERLQPVEIVGANLNVTQVVLDPLGRPIAAAARGKGSGDEVDVDSVIDLMPEVSPTDVDDILLDPTGEIARRVLGNAGSRNIHCIDRYALWKSRQDTQTSTKDAKTSQLSAAPSNPVPAFSICMTRHVPFGKSSSPEIRVSVSYMNGLGTQLHEVHLNDPTTLDKRWLIPGLSVSDTQGHAVCTYQARFAVSPTPITAKLMNTNATIAFGDALGRSVASLSPDCTWSKTVYTPWTVVQYTAGNMVLRPQPQDDIDVGHFFTRISAARYSHSWYDRRRLGVPQEQRAAQKSSEYADAPITTHLGSCELPIRVVQKAGDEIFTRSSAYDVNGNRVRDIDSYQRLVEKMVYDKLGRRLQSTGMDQGESWQLQDAQGGELLSWNCRGHYFMTQYDALRRETEKLAAKGEEIPKLVMRIKYGEECADATALNLKNQVWKVEDQAGLHVSTRYDIRGHCVEETLQLTQEYKKVIDWKVDNELETAPYSHKYSYDNYGQVLEEEDAQGNRTRRHFTLQGHTDSVDFKPSKDTEWRPYLSSATFSADGLPVSVRYGNKVITDFSYDDESRHLVSQRTTRPSRGARELLQGLTHVYDCVGRRIYTHDSSEQVKYFSGSRIKPEWDYTYDVTGRLVSATGRAQLSANLGNGNQLSPHNAMNGLKPSHGVTDGNLLYQYFETYQYDREGNILQMKHNAQGIKGVTGWTRNYFYDEQSLLSDDPHVKSNRLSATAIEDKAEGKYLYSGDAGLSGCMTTMPKFSELEWNMDNILSFSSTQYLNAGTPERTYYVYDHSGSRVRKVTESAASVGEEPRKQKETRYLGGVELQTKGDGSEVWIARVTGDNTLAIVEFSSSRQKPLVRFQTGDCLELDDQAQLVSYEEYSPFGSVVYSAVYGKVEAPRIYRFAKYEHDRETGLYHCGLRYYCPWLGRWTSPDPLGDVDGPNIYGYVHNDPINSYDPSGTSGKSKTKDVAMKKKEDAVKFKSAIQTRRMKKKEAGGYDFNLPDSEQDEPKDKVSRFKDVFDKGKAKAKRAYVKLEEKLKRVASLGSSCAKFEKTLPPSHFAKADAANEKISTDGVRIPTHQHHLFQSAYSHIFKAAGIDSNAATLHITEQVHTIFHEKHDVPWRRYFVNLAKQKGTDLPTNDPNDEELYSLLCNKKSDLSKELVGEITANEAEYREKFIAQMFDNLEGSGLTYTKIEPSIRYYKPSDRDKGILIDMQRYTGLKTNNGQ